MPTRIEPLSRVIRQFSKPALQYFECYRYARLHPVLDCSPSADWRPSGNTWGRLHQTRDRCSYGGGSQGFRYRSSRTSFCVPIPWRESLAASTGGWFGKDRKGNLLYPACCALPGPLVWSKALSGQFSQQRRSSFHQPFYLHHIPLPGFYCPRLASILATTEPCHATQQGVNAAAK